MPELHQPRDPVDQGARLPRPGARHDQERAVAVQDRLRLPGVQRFFVVDLPAVGGDLPDGIFSGHPGDCTPRGAAVQAVAAAGAAGADVPRGKSGKRGSGFYLPGCAGGEGAGMAGTSCGRTGPGIDEPGIPPFMIVGEILPLAK